MSSDYEQFLDLINDSLALGQAQLTRRDSSNEVKSQIAAVISFLEKLKQDVENKTLAKSTSKAGWGLAREANELNVDEEFVDSIYRLESFYLDRFLRG